MTTNTAFQTAMEPSPLVRFERPVPGPQTLRKRTVAGFDVIEREYPAGLVLAEHAHERAQFVYGIEGVYLENYEQGRKASCAPGLLRYLPAGLKHSNAFESGARCLIIAIDPEMLDRVALHSNPLAAPRQIGGVAAGWLAQRLYAEFSQDDPLSSISLEGVLLEILAEFARQSAAAGPVADAPRWLRVAREYAETNFRRSLRLNEIADTAGVHRVHLAREFRRHYSITVGEFLRQKRLDHACRLLCGTEDALADIAIASGFSDQSHFGATFRRHVGLTPARFRLLAQRRSA